MNEWINTGQPPLSEEYLEQVRTAIRDTLKKTEKGGIAGSIQNCVIVFENDPTFAGKISRNLLTETDDIISGVSWQRSTTRFDDQDLPHVLLYFEQHYGIRSEKSIENAFKVVASKHTRVTSSAPSRFTRKLWIMRLTNLSNGKPAKSTRL